MPFSIAANCSHCFRDSPFFQNGDFSSLDSGAGATVDRSTDQVVRPGCLGLNSRRKDALTAAPKQDTAPLPNTERRAPIRKHLSRMPPRCDALPSTNPVEIMGEATGYDLAKSDGSIPSTSLHLTGSEVLCWIIEGVSLSAAPSDVGLTGEQRC